MQLDSYKEQDQEKQKMITKLAIIKSIWESGAIPKDLPVTQQNWIREMFYFTMDLIGAKEVNSETYTSPFETPIGGGLSSYKDEPIEGLKKASLDEIVSDENIKPKQPKGNYQYPPFIQKQGCISEAQSRRLFAIAKSKNLPSKLVNAYINKLGYASTADIPWKKYNEIIAWAEGDNSEEVPF